MAYTPSATVTNGDPVRLLPRAVTLLDYTPGGPDREPTLFPSMNQNLAATYGSMTVDVWGADEIHGEAGDDTVYAGGGNDVVYGDGGDDDVIGGWGHDWISGGTGQDGVLGDDGRIFTSRNGLAEPLNGVTASTQQAIATPGNHQTATIYETGKLNKTVDLTPFALNPRTTANSSDDPLFRPLYADDLIYGGLGSDFLHGGSGDDAISGAEALVESYMPNATRTGLHPLRLDRAVQPGQRAAVQRRARRPVLPVRRVRPAPPDHAERRTAPPTRPTPPARTSRAARPPAAGSGC